MTTREAVLEQTLDCDAHEMTPSHAWQDIFGPAAGRIAAMLDHILKGMGGNDFHNPTLTGDHTSASHENVWFIRGTSAPSAFDFGRRLEVMDVMGIERQLIFPSFALFAGAMATASHFFLREKWGLMQPLAELREVGGQGVKEYNRWAMQTTKLSPNRLRPVGFIADNSSVDSLIAQTKHLVDGGLRAINIPAGTPPGGVSPADDALDPFWGYCEANDIPVVLHLGGEFGFIADAPWSAAAAFKLDAVKSQEIGLEPYSFATIHFAPENFLTVMVLGGVFEKFPRLRFGVLETGARWFGPLAERLDMWASEVFAKRLQAFISMPPSAYLARNVRITPFNGFEPIEQDFQRYPHLADSYCYSTDYPHMEGGTDIKRRFYERLAPLGHEVLRKFFYENGLLLLP